MEEAQAIELQISSFLFIILIKCSR